MIQKSFFRRWDFLFFLMIAAVTAGVTWSVGDKTYDDAYITFRYARNLALGRGFTYNPGEPFLGTTTPLLTILLALSGRLFSADKIPQISQIISGLALFGCGVLLYLLAREQKKNVAGVTAAFLMILNPVLIDTWGGEAIPLLCLVLATVYSYVQGMESTSAVLVSLAFLTRGEGILLAVILYPHYLITKKRFPWRAALSFGIVLGGWFLYSVLEFGSPFPSTLQAKMAQLQSGFWAPFFITSLEWLAAYIIPTPHFSNLGPNYSFLTIVALAGMGGIYMTLKPEFRWWAIIGWVGLYTAGYTIIGVPFYRWYVAPLVLAGMVLAGLGAQFIYDFVHHKGYTHRTATIVIILILIPPLFTASRKIYTFAVAPIHSEYRLYIKTGQWLNQHSPTDATVSYFEIGYLGYFADRTIIDPVGLVNPGVADQVARGNMKWAIKYYKPDYLVIHPVRWYNRIGNIREEPWFKTAYKPVAAIEQEDYYLHVPLIIYKKINDEAIPTP